MTNTPKAGDNNPPEPTPFEIAQEEIGDLRQQAIDYLDGDPISTQGQADDVQQLMRMIQEAQKTAEKSRKKEAQPFDDGKAEIQARYNPLIKKKTGICDLAIDTCRKALTPWLEILENKRLAAAKNARLKAEEAERRAAEARRIARESESLQAREEAEIAAKAADKANKAATRVEKSKSGLSGTVGRKTTLRTTYTPELEELKLAIAHYWKIDRQAFEDLVRELAARDVRAGKRQIPGFNIKEEMSAA